MTNRKDLLEQIKKKTNKMFTLTRKIEESERLSLVVRISLYKKELNETNEALQELLKEYNIK